MAAADAKPGDLEAARAVAGAADDLARRLAGRQSDQARAASLARAERALNEPEAVADPVGSATRQKAIAAELALLPVNKKEEAAARVALAAQLADSADQPDDDQAGTSRPVPSAVAEARTRAAQALDARRCPSFEG